MKIKNLKTLIIFIIIPLAVGGLSALISGNMSNFSTINKPPLNPPAFVFPIVWTILYVLMGISSYLVYESNNVYKVKALKIYAIQLFFNFFWSIIFFLFSKYLLALLWLIILIVLIILMIYKFYKVNPTAAYLQIPYLLWCLFAAYLNYMIYLIN